MIPNFVKKIEGQIKKPKNKSSELARIYYFFMKELNQSYSEIGLIPIPLANALMAVAKEESDKMDKEMKKSRGKKRGK